MNFLICPAFLESVYNTFLLRPAIIMAHSVWYLKGTYLQTILLDINQCTIHTYLLDTVFEKKFTGSHTATIRYSTYNMLMEYIMY